MSIAHRELRFEKLPEMGETRMLLPCGSCLGCRTAKAKEWALRCTLELQSHEAAAFTTLTYDNEHCPENLQKRDLQLFLKRIRKRAAGTVRFFASGEYGEKNGRPHYHAILYGMSARDEKIIDKAWGMGNTKTGDVTPASIAYCAGYTSKKIGWNDLERESLVVDPSTGEILSEWIPPFLQMSRRPGIGAAAKQHTSSWRAFAILNGQKMPVPRYLHQAWKDQASEEELQQLADEQSKLRDLSEITAARLESSELIAIAQQRLQAARRKY